MEYRDFDHLTDEDIEALARIKMAEQREKEEWAKKNLPNNSEEAYRRMAEAAIPEPEKLSAAQLAYIERMPKTTEEAYRRMAEAAIPEPEKLTAEERAYIERMPKNLGESLTKMAESSLQTYSEDNYYKGMVPEDPDKYRYQTTGTTNVDSAKIVDELSKFDISLTASPDTLLPKLQQIIQEPEAISKLMENRMKNTSDFLYSWGDYNKEHIYTDLSIISQLVENNFDFSSFKVDLSTMLVENPDIVNLDGLLEYYEMGLISKKAEGKNTQIPNPKNPNETITAEQLIDTIKEQIKTNQVSNDRVY